MDGLCSFLLVPLLLHCRMRLSLPLTILYRRRCTIMLRLYFFGCFHRWCPLFQASVLKIVFGIIVVLAHLLFINRLCCGVLLRL